MKTRGFRRSTAAAAMLALLASIMFVVTNHRPAEANHGTQQGFDFPPTQEPRSVLKGSLTQFFISFNESVTSRTLVMMEIEIGQSDPEFNDPDGAPQYSPSKPEAWCFIEKDESSCTIEFTFQVVPIIGVDNVTAVFYVNNHLIDNYEPTNESQQTGYGCDGVTDGAGGHEFEPDLTEKLQIFVYGAIGGTPDPAVPPPPGVNVPWDCDNPPSGGGSPTPTDTGSATPTDTGSATPTDTGSATPTDTGSATPTDTGSATPTDTGSPAPTNTNTGNNDPGGTFGEITIGVTPNIGTYGTDFTVAGEIACKGVKVANARVQIYRTFVGARTISMIETATDVQGRYAFRDTDLSASADYAATWNGKTTGGATSACSSGAESGNERKRALVRPGVIVNVRDATLKTGDTAIFAGAVLPRHAGKKVFLQVYHGQQKEWKYATEARLDRNSRYVMRFRHPQAGFLLFRVAYATQDFDHAWNLSRNVRVDWA